MTIELGPLDGIIKPTALRRSSGKNFEHLRIQAVVLCKLVKGSKWISEQGNLLEENVAVNSFIGEGVREMSNTA